MNIFEKIIVAIFLLIIIAMASAVSGDNELPKCFFDQNGINNVIVSKATKRIYFDCTKFKPIN